VPPFLTITKGPQSRLKGGKMEYTIHSAKGIKGGWTSNVGQEHLGKGDGRMCLVTMEDMMMALVLPPVEGEKEGWVVE
jgi:hypothetical protein